MEDVEPTVICTKSFGDPIKRAEINYTTHKGTSILLRLDEDNYTPKLSLYVQTIYIGDLILENDVLKWENTGPLVTRELYDKLKTALANKKCGGNQTNKTNNGGGNNSRKIKIGPNGGRYYVSKGKKVYVPK